MSQPGHRLREIFPEVFESLPRQGPGNRACAARALALCRGLPERTAILDLLAGEPGTHRRHADFHAHEFFVVRRTPGPSHPE